MPSNSRFQSLRVTATGALVAGSGGLAAAVMVAAAAKHLAIDGKLHLGTSPVPPQHLLPMMLGFLSPLPLMVATVGFGAFTGAIAVLVGTIAFVAISTFLVGDGLVHEHMALVMGLRAAGFVALFGCPALLLGTLARQRAAPAGAIDPVPDPRRARPEERLVGRVLAATVGVSAVLFGLAVVAVVHVNGGYHAVLQDMVKQIQPVLDANPNGKEINATWLARIALWFITLLVSGECVCLFALNLWLAGRVAQTSGLLTQPWPDLPRTLRVPTPLAIVAAVAFGLSFAGGLFGLLSVAVAGSIAAAFGFQGLAVVHQLTRGSTWRTSILSLIYLTLSFFPPLLLTFAAVGLCDAAFFFRDRQQPIVVKKPGPPKKPGPWS